MTTDDIPDVRADQPEIPAAVLIFNPHHPHTSPEVFHEGSTYSGLERVADTIFHAMREERFLVSPHGVLYMEQNAYDLTEVFARMWNAPESLALRAIHRHHPDSKSARKAAEKAITKMWADFLWDVGVTE